VDVVAIVALARSVEEEALALAADLGLTAYETGVALRAPMPVIVLRTDDRARALEILGKLRSRRHEVVAFDVAAVVSSEDMFRPKSFRLEPGEIVGLGQGEEHRLPFTNVFALVRAHHRTQIEETVTNNEVKLSLGRAAMTGGLMATKVKTTERKRVVDEKEPVLYVFRSDGPPWLLRGTVMNYDGLGPALRVSKMENFEVLVNALRELAPSAPFDTRLLSARPAPHTLAGGAAHHFSTSSSGAIDLLAHVVATSLGQSSRPYR
jgi:hypothetical protein